jgi:hypothetical protein
MFFIFPKIFSKISSGEGCGMGRGGAKKKKEKEKPKEKTLNSDSKYFSKS